MKKTENKHLRALVLTAMLSALSIILGKYLALPIGDILRFSFENLPIIFAGIVLGPLGGALVGTVADLLGCVLVGYVINPVVTVGAFSIGLISGAVYRLLKNRTCLSQSLSVALAVALSHLVGSVLIKTFGLSAFYGMPYIVLMLWRLLNYAIVGVIEGLLLSFLVRNKNIGSLIAKFSEKRNNKDSGKEND